MDAPPECRWPRDACPELALWIDDTPRDGPLNMAVDEALVLSTAVPVLRVYRWAGPWVSVGCFGSYLEAAAASPGRPLVRRWTGGGLVDHADDWTYALVVPRGVGLATLGTSESYRLVHEALAGALASVGVATRLADAPLPGRGGHCFQAPVLADLVDQAGRKIAGAAQRRTRQGLLHQGSLQGLTAPPTLAAALARALSGSEPRILSAVPADLLALAGTLSREKYATRAWLERR